jgi:hypothetical protein
MITNKTTTTIPTPASIDHATAGSDGRRRPTSSFVIRHSNFAHSLHPPHGGIMSPKMHFCDRCLATKRSAPRVTRDWSSGDQLCRQKRDFATKVSRHKSARDGPRSQRRREGRQEKHKGRQREALSALSSFGGAAKRPRPQPSNLARSVLLRGIALERRGRLRPKRRPRRRQSPPGTEHRRLP